jgi:hypothetical protein
MEKPKTLYNNPWYLITFYGDYDVTENPLNIPETFGNFNDNSVDTSDPEQLREAVKGEFTNWLDEGDNEVEERLDSPIALYVIPFDDADDLVDFSDLIEGMQEGDRGKIDIEQYHLIVKTLSKQQLIILNYKQNDLE